ncbi:MAG: hypothetical protein ISEC1_P1934 [Thiomicrorhabdus sp.]|nr:MAG: hypothetical protein ISEC1_P1934 [Thiomicrorhabdus sp.]
MKYYKDANNNIHGFELDGKQDAYINPDFILIDEAAKTALLAPTQAQLDKARKAEITERLNAIDTESIRPLRAVANGTAVAFDTDKLAALDAERAALVVELGALNV